jgi:thiol-disulfide isomerase/thioredoxin
MFDLVRLRENSETVDKYLTASSKKTPTFHERKKSYQLNSDIATELQKYIDQFVVFAFSAEWCPDCQRNIPVLGLISETTGMEVNIFGNLMRDPKNPKAFWRIPPSPAEVKEFNVTKIPAINILTLGGHRIGEIIENPPENKSLELSILEIIQKQITK